MQAIYTKQLCLDLCKTIQSAARINRKDGFWPINQSDCRKLKCNIWRTSAANIESNTIFLNNLLLPFQWNDQIFPLEAFQDFHFSNLLRCDVITPRTRSKGNPLLFQSIANML